jgi:hypothetical protein
MSVRGDLFVAAFLAVLRENGVKIEERDARPVFVYWRRL